MHAQHEMGHLQKLMQETEEDNQQLVSKFCSCLYRDFLTVDRTDLLRFLTDFLLIFHKFLSEF